MKKQREDSTELTVKGVAKGIAGEEALVAGGRPDDIRHSATVYA